VEVRLVFPVRSDDDEVFAVLDRTGFEHPDDLLGCEITSGLDYQAVSVLLLASGYETTGGRECSRGDDLCIGS
jgi:hypothetical protein